MRRLKEWKRIL